eukprot:2083167-Amphidinium_carterae.1
MEYHIPQAIPLGYRDCQCIPAKPDGTSAGAHQAVSTPTSAKENIFALLAHSMLLLPCMGGGAKSMFLCKCCTTPHALILPIGTTTEAT